MSETVPADSTTELKPSRLEFWFLRRIRLWVVGLIVLVLIAGAVSFWWPMYRAGKFIDSIKAKGGHVVVQFQHPKWLFWIGDKIYHPWFDSCDGIWMRGIPIDESQLEELRRFSEIKSLAIETQDISPDTIRSLSEFRNLDFLAIFGKGNRCPLDWIDSLPKLRALELNNVSVSKADWTSLALMRLKIGLLSFENMNLDASAGKSISSIPWLKQLHLERCRTTPDFWEYVAKSSKLWQVRLSDIVLGADELQQLNKLPALKMIEVSPTKIAPEDLQVFKETRSDVEIILSEELPSTD